MLRICEEIHDAEKKEYTVEDLTFSELAACAPLATVDAGFCTFWGADLVDAGFDFLAGTRSSLATGSRRDERRGSSAGSLSSRSLAFRFAMVVGDGGGRDSRRTNTVSPIHLGGVTTATRM
jgi:hypothetical protein